MKVKLIWAPPTDLNTAKIGLYLVMRDKLQVIREMAKSRMLEVPPFAGEEMTLPQTDAHRDGFIDGERTLAAQILKVIDEPEFDLEVEERVLGRHG